MSVKTSELRLRPVGRATIALLLAIAVLLVFSGALGNGFVNYDDPDYLTANHRVQSGLTWSNMVWAFQTTHAANWHPLTWLSHMADCQLFGLDPRWHHLTSVLFHALATVLLFLALWQMTAATGRSFLVAALFGLHPLRVESVAWACERKDVLAAFFWMLTVWLYVLWSRRYDAQRRGSAIYYLVTMISFALGLMSKSVLVTLPLILLLLDYWPLKRWQTSDQHVNLRRRINEKLPLLGLAMAAAIITLQVQKNAGAVKTITSYPLDARIGNAIVSYGRYLAKLAYPANLAAFYPHPVYWPLFWIIASGLLLALISVIAVRWRRTHPYLLTGWGWYLVTAWPIIGLIQVGAQAIADRYTYIPSVGVFVMLVWGLSDLTAAYPHHRFARTSLGALALLACIILTSSQIRVWHDSETLFRHTIAVTQRNPLAHMNLGVALMDRGDHAAGLRELTTAVEMAPQYSEAHLTLATALEHAGELEHAVNELDEAIRLNSKSFKAYFEAGVVFDKMGHAVQAAKLFQEAIRLMPDYADAHNDLGAVLEKTGRTSEAMAEYEEALRLDGNCANAHQNLGNMLFKAGRIGEATTHFEEDLKLAPNSPTAHNNLASAFFLQGKLDEAIAHYREALKLKADYSEARANLAAVLAAKEAHTSD